jgi:hypothetical protein
MENKQKQHLVSDNPGLAPLLGLLLLLLPIAYALSEWQTSYQFKSFSQYLRQEWTWHCTAVR